MSLNGINLQILVITLLLSVFFTQQLPHPVRKFQKESNEQKILKLEEQLSKNKTFIKELKLASLIALQFYPELQDVRIKFIWDDTKTTMETRPNVGSLMNGRRKREYIIFVDNKMIGNDGILV